MEGRKRSNSLTAELFGSKESPASSSSGLFNSIFPPPSKVHGKDHISAEVNHNYATQGDIVDKKDESESPKKKDLSSFYHQERSQPCHLSSSIYDGGQDIYINPHNTKTNTEYSKYDKYGEDDGQASRGNWWQGSLYY